MSERSKVIRASLAGGAVQVIIAADMDEDTTPAEALGLAVALSQATLEDARDLAREVAVALEQDAAEARRHLAAVLGVIKDQGWRSSWLHNTVALEAAQAFVDADPVPREDPTLAN